VIEFGLRIGSVRSHIITHDLSHPFSLFDKVTLKSHVKAKQTKHYNKKKLGNVQLSYDGFFEQF